MAGTPALPPHLDFFEVAKERRADRAAGREASGPEEAASLLKNHKLVENNFHIPGIEPLPAGLADYPMLSVASMVSSKKVSEPCPIVGTQSGAILLRAQLHATYSLDLFEQL